MKLFCFPPFQGAVCWQVGGGLTSGANNLLTQAQLQLEWQLEPCSVGKWDALLAAEWKRANATVMILFIRPCRSLHFTYGER